MSPNQERHAALKDIFYTVTSHGENPLLVAYSVEVAFNNAGKKNESKRQKALSYLIAGYYLKYIDFNKEGKIIPSVLMLESGVRALHSEYFLEQHQENISRRNNNRWMILTNCVVAAAAIFALLKTEKSPHIQQEIKVTLDSATVERTMHQIENHIEKKALLSSSKDSL